MSQKRGPLAGVKVIEAATYMTGPYATLQLADLGADVIKVEAPGSGDTFRNFGRPPTYVSAPFAKTLTAKNDAEVFVCMGSACQLPTRDAIKVQELLR